MSSERVPENGSKPVEAAGQQVKNTEVFGASSTDESAATAQFSDTRPYIGGQAVIEGVMMRSPRAYAVVLRRKDGTLQARWKPMPAREGGWKAWPIARGIVSLVESIKLGGEALRYSAEAFEHDNRAEGEAEAPKEEGGMGKLVMLLPLVVLVAAPQAGAEGVQRLLHLNLPMQSAGFQVLTGVLKLALVLGYLALMRRIPEIKRVFEYHGAEHKTITTYEAEKGLTVQHARSFTTLHARCGTTFLVLVVMVSIVVFGLIGASLLPSIATGNKLLDNVVFFLIKLPAMPFVAALAFEIQRVIARYCQVGPLKFLSWPGFAVQKITTAEPDDAQLEIALASLGLALAYEEGRLPPATPYELSFASYEAFVAAHGVQPNSV